MTNLIHTEWLKLRKYKAFWWMTGIIMLSYPGINYLLYQLHQSLLNKPGPTGEVATMLLGNPFSFPEVWHTVAYASSIFVFIPSLVVIMFITNEYTYKTHRQNIIDGWSRNQFLSAKLISVLFISMLATILFFIVAFIIGSVNSAANVSAWENSKYILLFALQIFSQLSIAFFIAFITRKAFIALGIFLFYFIILEPIIVGIAKAKANDMGRFMPLEISDRLIPVPAFLGRFDEKGYKAMMAGINEHVLYSIIVTAAIWGVCFWLNSRRDL